MQKLRLVITSVVITAIAFSCLFAAYFLYNQRNQTNPKSNIEQITAPRYLSEPANDNPLMPSSNSVEIQTMPLTSLEIVLRLFLAVILAGILAFRPRKNVPLVRRNLYVAQTQILLAVVAAALMLIVGDNTARAFAIFAAVSLVRFRTNIRDPKEVTVLLISLSLGLATGVGRWDLGLILCIFALILLWVLEFNESAQVFRSMELTIKTRNTDSTMERVRGIFKKYELDAEVRQINPPDDENEIGSIMYYMNLRLNLSTDFLSDKIFEDSQNIEGIEWAQKKGNADMYQ